MNESKRIDKCMISMNVSTNNNALEFIIEVTNVGDTTINTTSPMGSWCEFTLHDENNINRIDEMVSVAMVTSWTIKPGNTLRQKYTTNTPKQAKKKADDLNLKSVTVIHDTEEYKNKQNKSEYLYIPSVCLDKDKDVTLYPKAEISLDIITDTLSFEFKPSEI